MPSPSIVREEWDEPEERVVAEDQSEVLAEASIVGLLRVERVVLLAALLAELDSREGARDQVQVERHEGCDDKCQHRRQNVRSHHKVAHFVIEAVGVAQRARDHIIARQHYQQAGERAVEEHVHKEFVVVESDAVGDPRAVMVHLQDAPVALGAMMAPIGLRLVAPLANAHTTVAFALNGGGHAHH
eukprot:CAMPEP_0185581814 /NCGR_PEP_ID=MMETSP0434-20130131/19055_1 /TAXON_ID=626734 ORGANISM="Favella taraikaensis, Strain Fe Narragansett Bay" /NCGR_SAMPLE_ID=MMETSP0434 /ASSEMBLY_ACC=CAM_ASM_000379 /LENGTH=185 /DNA_ID=CAMNT_0028200443 /DNA_START=366 /DNA_END=922 /DNA_ORIENTATION=-